MFNRISGEKQPEPVKTYDYTEAKKSFARLQHQEYMAQLAKNVATQKVIEQAEQDFQSKRYQEARTYYHIQAGCALTDQQWREYVKMTNNS